MTTASARTEDLYPVALLTASPRTHALIVALSALLVPVACLGCDVSLRLSLLAAASGGWSYAAGAI